MIDERKLAELRKAYPVDTTTFGTTDVGKTTLLVIFDTIDSLLKIARSAEHGLCLQAALGESCPHCMASEFLNPVEDKAKA